LAEQHPGASPIRQIDITRAAGLVMAYQESRNADFIQTFGATMTDPYLSTDGGDVGVYATKNVINVLAMWAARVFDLENEIGEGQAMDTLRAALDEITRNQHPDNN
jgi:hypothetical protein